VPAILAWSADPAVRGLIGKLPDSEEAEWTRVLSCACYWSLFVSGRLPSTIGRSGKIVGEVSAGFFRHGVDPMLDSLPEPSWLFSSGGGGRGFAFEAMTGLLRWLLQATSHGRIACLIEPTNLPSLSSPKSCGSGRSRCLLQRKAVRPAR